MPLNIHQVALVLWLISNEVFLGFLWADEVTRHTPLFISNVAVFVAMVYFGLKTSGTDTTDPLIYIQRQCDQVSDRQDVSSVLR